MNTNDPKFEAMIGDPDFQKLPQDQQFQLVDEYKQHVMGRIPNSFQGVLNNATKGIQSLGHMATVGRDAFMNTATFGGTEALEKSFPLPDNINTPLGSFDPNMAQPQNPAESVMKGIGNIGGFMGGGPEALMKGVGTGISSIIPGLAGKVVGSVGAGAAGGFSLPGDMNSRLMHAGIGSIVNPAFEGAIGAGKGISSLMDVNQTKAKLFDATQNASETIGSDINETSQAANKTMGKELGAIQDTGLNQETGPNEALRKVAEIHPNLAKHVLPLIEDIAPETDVATGVVKDIPNMSGSELQNKIIETSDAIDHPVAKAEFGTQMSKLLPDSMRSVKASRAGVYSATDAAQPLTKIGIQNRIAKGLVTPETLQGYKQAAANVGNSSSIDDVIKAGGNLKRAQSVKGLTKLAGKAIEYGGILELLRHIFH